jgi:isopenicillin-N epimerase
VTGGANDLRDLFLLRRDVIFLNHGSFGACPRPVFDAYHRWQVAFEAEPVDFMKRARERLAEARRALAAFLGAPPDDLVFVTNATTGVNIVARSLHLGPEDEVLTTDHEYGGVDRVWRFVCEQTGATLVRAAVPLPAGSREAIVEAIWSRVTPRTRVLAFSHVAAPTAIILPVEELARRARAVGILTVIDGAHAPGQIPLDLDALGADFYAGNCHKWMCAPKGAGFLYARRPAQDLLRPLVVSWGWRPEKPGPSRFIDEHEWQGTRDIAAYLAVPAAIAFFASHGWDGVRMACPRLVTEARAALNAATGQPALCPEGPAWYGQMASVFLPGCDAETTSNRLREEFGIEVPIWQWGDRQLLRVSVQGYNTPADVEALVGAVRGVLGL